MATVKTQDGKVVLKEGKVSCECCVVDCFGGYLTAEEKAALVGTYRFVEYYGASIYQPGDVSRISLCVWEGASETLGYGALILSFASSIGKWGAATDNIYNPDPALEPYIKTGGDQSSPLGTYISADMPGYSVVISSL